MGDSIADGLQAMAVIAFIVVVLLVSGMYKLGLQLGHTDSIESEKIIIPEVVINTESVDGVINRDTLYIYRK